jgi:hypothetical protein
MFPLLACLVSFVFSLYNMLQYYYQIHWSLIFKYEDKITIKVNKANIWIENYICICYSFSVVYMCFFSFGDVNHNFQISTTLWYYYTRWINFRFLSLLWLMILRGSIFYPDEIPIVLSKLYLTFYYKLRYEADISKST